MAVVTVRNLPEATHRALKLRPAQHGRSTEAEIRGHPGAAGAAQGPGQDRLRTCGIRQAPRGHRPEDLARPVPDGDRQLQMIILDTNVVSEPMRRNSDPAVAAWLDQQAAETLYLTATSLSELLIGIAILPKGKRRGGLDSAPGDFSRRRPDRRHRNGPWIHCRDKGSVALHCSGHLRHQSVGRRIGPAPGAIAI